MRTRYYILTGIITYFVFLIATVPAAPVIGMLQDRLPISISNVSGTLWSGRASTINTKRNLTLNNIQWSFLPWRLLLVKVAIDVNADFNNKPLTTQLSTGISGVLAVKNLNMQLDAADITPLISLPLGELSGDFLLRINNAYFKQGTVPRVEGTLNWNQATLTVAETAELGNVSILINESDESPLSANISNKGGHLSLSGNLTTSEQGEYTVQLSMKPNATASSNLVNSLAMFAKKQRNGEYVLNNKGNLKQLGLM